VDCSGSSLTTLDEFDVVLESTTATGLEESRGITTEVYGAGDSSVPGDASANE
jgi:hypothetical protein